MTETFVTSNLKVVSRNLPGISAGKMEPAEVSTLMRVKTALE
jgi:hypothetical protein